MLVLGWVWKNPFFLFLYIYIFEYFEVKLQYTVQFSIVTEKKHLIVQNTKKMF